MRTSRRPFVEEPSLNLIPMLDMVSLLIQMLLLNAHFGSIVVLPTALGRQTADAAKTLGLTVSVSPSGFDVSWAEAGERSSRGLRCAGGTCEGPESYDAKGLAGLAAEIKKKNPEETAVQLLVHPDVAFECMAVAMDATRGRTGNLFPDVVLGTTP